MFEVFRDGTGMDTVHVPYKGGGQAINDVIGGQIEMTMAAVSVGKGLIEGGRVKGVAVTSPKRSPAIPDVPTLAEAGVKHADVELRFWFGLFAPKGVPAPVKAKIEKAVATVMAKPEVRARLAKLDIEPEYLPGPALRQRLENEISELDQVHRREGNQGGLLARFPSIVDAWIPLVPEVGFIRLRLYRIAELACPRARMKAGIQPVPSTGCPLPRA